MRSSSDSAQPLAGPSNNQILTSNAAIFRLERNTPSSFSGSETQSDHHRFNGTPPLKGVSHILRTTALGCCLTTFSISDKAKAVPLNSNTGEERTLEKNQRQPADFLKGRVQEKAGKPKIRRRDSRLEMQRKFY
jgi:hypothetical protein